WPGDPHSEYESAPDGSLVDIPLPPNVSYGIYRGQQGAFPFFSTPIIHSHQKSLGYDSIRQILGYLSDLYRCFNLTITLTTSTGFIIGFISLGSHGISFIFSIPGVILSKSVSSHLSLAPSHSILWLPLRLFFMV
ncbi:hypothetical protein FS842_006082, partial [Serendipita sp. 407]